MNRNVVLRVGLTLVLSSVLIGPVRSFAATTSTTVFTHSATDIMITEVQTSTLKNSGEEFVELYNNTTEDIDLADTAHSGKDAWKLQYFSGSKLSSLLGTPNWSSPFRTIALTGVIPAHDYYVLAGGAYQPGNIVPDQTYTATLSDSGGALQLIESATSGSTTTVGIHDQLAWSADKTLHANPLLYTAPSSGASLQRVPNDDSEYINADNTLTDFVTDSRISPANAWAPPLPAPAPSTDETAGDAPASDTAADNSDATPTVPNNDGLPTPLVTELLPNPASPQTDDANEYIELFNPGETAFNLKGYTLETGSTTLHDFTFTEDTLLQPHSFRAFFSSDTNLSLSNTAGRARLLDPAGKLLSQSNPYTKAPDGQAWALDELDGTWQWTTTPTPSASNLMHTPVVLAKASVVKESVPKVKAASAAKVKGASTTKKAKATKATKKKSSKPTEANTLAATTTTPSPAPLHAGVLAAVAVLAVGYGVYEYRHDLGNRIQQFRTHRATRRAARK
jgi:hypothetical protein